MSQRERVPQLVTLFGPAGVGKSRLLTEVARAASRCACWSRAVAFRTARESRYWPLAEAAKTHAGILDTDPADDRAREASSCDRGRRPRGARRARVRGGRVDDRILAPGARLGDRSAARSHAGSQDGWPRYVGALGREQLTVLVVEDVHWASSALLDLLEQLAETLADTQVLLVCTARPEFAGPSSDLGRREAERDDPRAVAALPGRVPRELVSSLLGDGGAPESRARPRAEERGGQSVLPRGDAADAHRARGRSSDKTEAGSSTESSAKVRDSRTRCTA